MSITSSERPNILFFFPDQHRFDWLGSNPNIPVRTPNLDGVDYPLNQKMPSRAAPMIFWQASVPR
ncbi:TPA: hypothetical protein EYP66_02665 [Candidatus Poribacteria bacterium]|nr:hypothetical protein [Candidatus Poribacteria bacterium]